MHSLRDVTLVRAAPPGTLPELDTAIRVAGSEPRNTHVCRRGEPEPPRVPQSSHACAPVRMSASRAARSAPEPVSGQQKIVFFGHMAGEECRDPFRDGGGRGAVRGRLKPAGEVRQFAVLGGQGAHQLAPAGLGDRGPVEGAFHRLGVWQDFFFQVLPQRRQRLLIRDAVRHRVADCAGPRSRPRRSTA